jgi:hypothetical protein
MTTRDIRTSHAHTVCDVCGRTLLRGERAEIYVNGGTRRSVCELCRPRAVHEGWVREGSRPDYSQSGPGSERRRTLLNRLRNRRGDRRDQARPSLDDELAGYEGPVEPVRRPSARPRFDGALDGAHWGAPEPLDEPPESAAYPPDDGPVPYRAHEPDDRWPEEDPEMLPSGGDLLDLPPPAYEAAWDDPDHLEDPAREDPEPRARRPWSRPPRSLRSSPAAGPGSDRPGRSGRPARSPWRGRADGPPEPGRGRPDRRAEAREPRHVRAVPSGHAQKIAAAVDLFNQSEHRRTVAGVARSLGGAGVSVRPAAEPPSLVHIVVWWELCWYRYTVDLSDAVPGVRVDGQGYELSELSEAERVANATADEGGQLILR